MNTENSTRAVDEGRRSSVKHWDETWKRQSRERLLTSLNVSVWDLKRFLRGHLRPGCTYMELGCAPGRMLAWTAVALEAKVSGLDYSATGVEATNRHFASLGIQGDIRQEDVFNHSFRESSFDFVGSFGLIEHFDDPREIIRKHVQLVKPGGTAFIVIPDYGGIYGRWQGRFDPENLAIHNTKIMNLETLSSCAPLDLAERVRVYRQGRLSPWLISLHKRIPSPAAKLIYGVLNVFGLLQPVQIDPLCWMIVLEVVKK